MPSVVKSIPDFINRIKRDSKGWGIPPWFRGEPDSPRDVNNNSTHLIPKVYRLKPDGSRHDENQLLQNFRLKAPTLGFREIPLRRETDQWLFLAQHFGLPTRLLDWTESALTALYFALQTESPVVWMLNPITLNNLSLPDNKKIGTYTFPLTWFSPEIQPIERRDLLKFRLILRNKESSEGPRVLFPPELVVPTNIGSRNIRDAWESEREEVGTELPVAIIPTNIHPRMSVQKSCFTIHGRRRVPITRLVRGQGILKKYRISKRSVDSILADLRLLGVSHSTLFPDLGGLAEELGMIY